MCKHQCISLLQGKVYKCTNCSIIKAGNSVAVDLQFLQLTSFLRSNPQNATFNGVFWAAEQIYASVDCSFLWEGSSRVISGHLSQNSSTDLCDFSGKVPQSILENWSNWGCKKGHPQIDQAPEFGRLEYSVLLGHQFFSTLCDKGRPPPKNLEIFRTFS